MNNSFYDPYPHSYYRSPQPNYRNGNMNDLKENVRSSDKECKSENKAIFPEKTALAMAYVPYQTEFTVYDSMKALKSGTLFPCLDKPFAGCCRYD